MIDPRLIHTPYPTIDPRTVREASKLLEVSKALSNSLRDLSFSSMGVYFSLLFTSIGAERVRKLQEKYNEAVEKFGPDSEKAQEALRNLRDAEFQLLLTQGRLVIDTVYFISYLPQLGKSFMDALAKVRMALSAASAAERAYTQTTLTSVFQRIAAINAETQAIRAQTFALSLRNLLAMGGIAGLAGVAAAFLIPQLIPSAQTFRGEMKEVRQTGIALVHAGEIITRREEITRIPSAQTYFDETKEVKRTGIAVVHEGEIISRRREAGGEINVNFNGPIFLKDRNIEALARDVVERIKMRMRAL